MIFVFKAIHGLAPTYIQELINVRGQQRYSLRSSRELLLEYPKGKSFPTLGDRAFVSAAPRLWNNLPSAVRDVHSLTLFKAKLKTFLFQEAFGNI